MNIAIFTDTYSPTISGAVTSIKMLEAELRAMGHKVYIFTVANPKAEKKRPNVFGLPSMPLSFIPTQRVAFLYPPNILLKFRALKLDVIHTQTEFPLGILGKLVSGFYRIPIVHTYHTMYVDYLHYIANGHLVTPKMAEKYSRVFCNGANRIIAPTAKVRESLIGYGVKRPIDVIPTGFDLSRFAPGRYAPDEIIKLKEKLNIPENAPVVVTVSRLAQEKSIDVVIRAIPELLKDYPALKYVIVGGGPSRDGLEKLSRELGLAGSVIFTGPVAWDEVGKYYGLGDCFAAASTSETQGLTYAEAMASNIPVAAKYDESLQELLQDGETGFMFDEDGDCADAIKRVLSDRERAKETAKRGFDSVQKLSSANFARQVLDVYGKCIENRPKRTVRISMFDFLNEVKTHVINIDKDAMK